MNQHNYLAFVLAAALGLVVLAIAPIHLFFAFMAIVCLILAADLYLE